MRGCSALRTLKFEFGAKGQVALQTDGTRLLQLPLARRRLLQLPLAFFLLDPAAFGFGRVHFTSERGRKVARGQRGQASLPSRIYGA